LLKLQLTISGANAVTRCVTTHHRRVPWHFV